MTQACVRMQGQSTAGGGSSSSLSDSRAKCLASRAAFSCAAPQNRFCDRSWISEKLADRCHDLLQRRVAWYHSLGRLHGFATLKPGLGEVNRTASLARFLAASCTASAACSFSLRPFTTFHSSRAVLTHACRIAEALTIGHCRCKGLGLPKCGTAGAKFTAAQQMQPGAT